MNSKYQGDQIKLGCFLETEATLHNMVGLPLVIASMMKSLPCGKEESAIGKDLYKPAKDVLQLCIGEQSGVAGEYIGRMQTPQCWEKLWDFYTAVQYTICARQMAKLDRCLLRQDSVNGPYVDCHSEWNEARACYDAKIDRLFLGVHQFEEMAKPQFLEAAKSEVASSMR
mmetsp:Transcript_18013/g.26829  ORF Transcript_18013/g.26829 Transcript_18013/m.26829 type:complete len:170 (+) Transcript_18013:1-510(+)